MITILVAGCAVAAFAGCESKEDFERCEMTCKMFWDCGLAPSACDAECQELLDAAKVDKCPPTTFTAQCAENQVDCLPACAVTDHPQCMDGPCLLYQYRDMDSPDFFISNEGFCSFECDPAVADSCPDEAQCLPFLGKNYCVPKKYIEPVEP